MKDYAGVSESTNWQNLTDDEAKYKALGCRIEEVSSSKLHTLKKSIEAKMDKLVYIIIIA